MRRQGAAAAAHARFCGEAVGIAAAALVVLLGLLWAVKRSLAAPADLKRTAPEKPYRSRVEYYEETKSNDVVVLDFPPEKESV